MLFGSAAQAVPCTALFILLPSVSLFFSTAHTLSRSLWLLQPASEKAESRACPRLRQTLLVTVPVAWPLPDTEDGAGGGTAKERQFGIVGDMRQLWVQRILDSST